MVTVYDFDGVIVNSFEVCLQVTRMYDAQMTPQEYRELFTGNIYASLQKRQSKGNLALTFDYWGNYSKLIYDIAPVPGIQTALDVNSRNKQVIISSTLSTIIDNYLKQYGLAGHFSQILGSDIEKSKKIKFGIIREKFPGEKFLFVTDTLGDINEANAAGIQTIAVDWGFHD